MSPADPSIPVKPDSARLQSMDAYRGFVMLCLAASGFGLKKVADNFPKNSVWQAIGYQFDHVPWVGCAFWDLIQPSFMFLVGVAMPYSFSRRETTGQSSKTILCHVLIRSFVLICLGIFLSSTDQPTTNFTFMNVLTQIGLGYSFLYLLRNRPFYTQLLAAILILGGYWAWFAQTPVQPIENLEDTHLPANWVRMEGFNAHWEKHVNPAATFDRWFLNLFPPYVPAPSSAPQQSSEAKQNGDVAADSTPNQTASPGFFGRIGQILRRLVTRPEPYVFNGGGYQTLNFIPSLVTMLFGLMAGEFIRLNVGNHKRIFQTLVIAGLLLLALGWTWHAMGGCPLVKRIWTPSWTLFSTGLTLLMLAGFYGIIDGLGWKAWSFPLVVAGMNSMVLYMMGQLLRGWTSKLLKRHVNENLFDIFGSNYSPLVESTLVMVSFWLFVYWLYRQKIFVRI